ncbi:MAG: hypothetical protein L6413_09020, partial [Coriobacteriia bacterium]|nr:hypothetical protein [Coriobacteriia bacterium]
MTRRQKRMTVVVVVLALLLAVLLAYFAYYRTTKKLTFDLSAPVSGVVSTPEYLYSFSGADKNRMQRPIGVLADGGEVFVADGERRDIAVFKPDGTPLRSFGASETAIPLYIAKNPLDGVLYVTDRRLLTIHKFTRDGKYLGDFAPNLPENVKPNFDTGGVEWAPVALDFAPDGKLYVVELLGGHRLIIFDPKGRFVKAVGTTGFVTDDDAEGIDVFQFPNSVKVRGDSVYIVDSNNRRVQVYSLDGIYQRTIVTQGLPRGLDFLKPFSSDEPSSTARMVIVDTLAHDGTIWTDGGEKILNFGEQGVLEGQFSYPNDVSIDDSNRIFISDTANGRIQVWGWPEIVSPVPVPRGPALWGCFAPLLLLPLALFFRKRKFLA